MGLSVCFGVRNIAVGKPTFALLVHAISSSFCIITEAFAFDFCKNFSLSFYEAIHTLREHVLTVSQKSKVEFTFLAYS